MADDGGDTKQDTMADDGIKRIRETAKWLTVSLGSIGALLLTGIQLAGIGKLDNDADRQMSSVWAMGIATAGVALILFGTVLTLARRPAKMKDIKGLTYANYPQFFADQGEDGEDVFNTYTARSAARIDAYAALVSAKDVFDAIDSGDTAKRQTAYLDYESKLNQYEQAVAEFSFVQGRGRALVRAADYQLVSNTWKLTIALVVVGLGLTVWGVGRYAWAVNPPDGTKASAAAPGVIDQVRQGTVIVDDVGATLINGSIATAQCQIPAAGGSIDGVLLKAGTTSQGPEVLLTGAAGCSSIRMILDPSWGAFAPAG